MADDFKTTYEDIDINSITDINEIKRLHSVLQKQEVNSLNLFFIIILPAASMSK